MLKTVKTANNTYKQNYNNSKYNKELMEFAQIAYTDVLTQEALLNGGIPIAETQPDIHADLDLTRQFDDMRYEAAQQGNIGGD